MALAVVPACAALAALLWAVTARAPVPFPLEWQESCMLEHALRLRAGEPLYVRPNLDFAPFPYPPLFHWLGELSVGFFGESLPALRAVSLISLAGLFACLFLAGGGASGVAAMGLFAASFGWTGFWFDTARVDTLALALAALAFVLSLWIEEGTAGARSTAMGAAAGAAAGLSILTKQTGVGLAVALALALISRGPSRRAGWVFAGVATVIVAPTVLYLQRVSDGAFWWTTVDLLRGSPWHPPRVLGFWVESAWFPALLAGLALSLRSRAGQAGSGPPALTRVGLLGTLALLAAAWMGRAHEGGFDNTLMPVALAGSFAVARGLRALAHPMSAARSWGPVSAALSVALVTLFLFQDPSPAMPGAADERAYLKAQARLSALAEEGEVWQPISALPPGSSGGVHKMAIVDLAKSRDAAAAGRLLDELTRALAAQRFAAIVLDAPPREGWGDLAVLIARSYEVVETLGSAADGAAREPLTPVTGAPLRPRVILRPRPR